MRIRQKLKSETGASITFALLLFLVCTMVSSVVIVAATTAGGRMSNLPDIDQRYYAVSSAAELIRGAIDGQVVTVVDETVLKKSTPYAADGTPGSSTENSTTTKKIYPQDISGIDDLQAAITAGTVNDVTASYSLLTELANTLTTSAASLSDKNITLTMGGSLTLNTNSSLSQSDALNILSVDILEHPEENGTLTFYVTKKVDSNKEYTLRLTFAVDKTENTVVHTDYGSPILSGTVIDATTTTTTTSFKWSLIGIVKDVVPT